MLTVKSRYLLFLLLVALHFSSVGNELKIDSLQSLVALRKDDSVKVDLLIELGTLYKELNQLDSAIIEGVKARDLAMNLNYAKGLGYANNLIGLVYDSKGDFSTAKIHYQEGLLAFQRINFKLGIANILSNLGVIYDQIGDLSKSIEYYYQSLKIAEEINDKQRIGIALLNLGTAYGAKDVTGERAKSYFLQSLTIFKELQDGVGIAIVNANMGTIYFELQNYDSAQYFYTEYLKLAEGTPEEAYGLRYMGEILAEKGDFESSFKYHDRSIQIASESGEKLYLADCLKGKATSLRKNGQVAQAISTYQKSLEILKELNAKKELKEVYESLSDLYGQVGDYQKAYDYQFLLTQIKDSLFRSSEGDRIQSLQFDYERDKMQSQIAIREATITHQRLINWAIGIVGLLILFMATMLLNRYKYVNRTNKIIQFERDRSKDLLLNILPEETANELERVGYAKTRYYESVSVLFTDFKSFSAIAAKVSPQELVNELNNYFAAFDDISSKYGLEKIKTIGDSYMCAGGIPVSNSTHAMDAVQAALEMQEFVSVKNKELQAGGRQEWELRIGIHTGPIVAGVVGKKKYAYDIWGDTVNVASRIESNGEPGKVNISDKTYELVKDKFKCQYRGKVSAKNIGDIEMFFVEGNDAVAGSHASSASG